MHTASRFKGVKMVCEHDRLSTMYTLKHISGVDLEVKPSVL